MSLTGSQFPLPPSSVALGGVNDGDESIPVGGKTKGNGSQWRGTVHERLPSLLDKIHGENLCVSLLLDMRFCHWDSQLLPADPVLPDVAMLRQTVEAFKASLALSTEEI